MSSNTGNSRIRGLLYFSDCVIYLFNLSFIIFGRCAQWIAKKSLLFERTMEEKDENSDGRGRRGCFVDSRLPPYVLAAQ